MSKFNNSIVPNKVRIWWQYNTHIGTLIRHTRVEYGILIIDKMKWHKIHIVKCFPTIKNQCLYIGTLIFRDRRNSLNRWFEMEFTFFKQKFCDCGKQALADMLRFLVFIMLCDT